MSTYRVKNDGSIFQVVDEKDTVVKYSRNGQDAETFKLFLENENDQRMTMNKQFLSE